MTREPEHQTPDITITPLQIEAWARPRLFDELIEGINISEVEAMVITLQEIEELPADILACLFEEHLEERVLNVYLRHLLVGGIQNLRDGNLPAPHELSTIAYPCYSLNQLARGLRSVRVELEVEPKWAGRMDEMIRNIEAAAKRLTWSGAYGVAQWLSDIADGYQPHPLSPTPGPA